MEGRRREKGDEEERNGAFFRREMRERARVAIARD